MSPQFQGDFPDIDEFMRDLAAANEFTQEDIRANRNGWISSRQFLRLCGQVSRPLWAALVALLVWGGGFTAFNMLLRPRLMRMVIFHSYIYQVLSVILTVLVAFVAALLKTTRLTFLLMKDLYHGQVLTVQGRLNATRQGESEKSRRVPLEPSGYFYWIRQERFEVMPEAYRILSNKYDDFKPVVKVYFTPRSRLILSIEPVYSR